MPQPLSADDLTDVIHTGHFELTSGLHSAVYNQTAVLHQDPARCTALCTQLLRELGREFDVVVAPALGAIVFGFECARLAGRPFLYSERAGGSQRLRRGQHLAPGQRVLVVENVLTTAGTVEEVLALVRGADARPVGVCALVVRRTVPYPWENEVPLVAVVRRDMPGHEPARCPQCAAGVGIDSPGSRRAS
ncbi:phosphoribosyltransferase family protein [Amycolatopsis sp. lyj-23]|uniref:phosphoribosyltransferase family protein n=1 Tax=Amycolatopsis sp. lyj-23 TaxID=2789283 RepID=UPI00397A6A2A